MPCSDNNQRTDKVESRAIKIFSIISRLKDLKEDIEFPKKYKGYGNKTIYVDEATKILCDFCKKKGEEYIYDEKFIYDTRFKVRGVLANWWTKHKKIDALHKSE